MASGTKKKINSNFADLNSATTKNENIKKTIELREDTFNSIEWLFKLHLIRL